jgi:alpha-galactosidase
MKFYGKKQFKEAIICFGLVQKRKFVKDDGDRVGAKCNWAKCLGRVYVRELERLESWRIASFKDKIFLPLKGEIVLLTIPMIQEYLKA